MPFERSWVMEMRPGGLGLSRVMHEERERERRGGGDEKDMEIQKVEERERSK